MLGGTKVTTNLLHAFQKGILKVPQKTTVCASLWEVIVFRSFPCTAELHLCFWLSSYLGSQDQRPSSKQPSLLILLGSPLLLLSQPLPVPSLFPPSPLSIPELSYLQCSSFLPFSS